MTITSITVTQVDFIYFLLWHLSVESWFTSSRDLMEVSVMDAFPDLVPLMSSLSQVVGQVCL